MARIFANSLTFHLFFALHLQESNLLISAYSISSFLFHCNNSILHQSMLLYVGEVNHSAGNLSLSYPQVWMMWTSYIYNCCYSITSIFSLFCANDFCLRVLKTSSAFWDWENIFYFKVRSCTSLHQKSSNYTLKYEIHTSFTTLI